MHKVNLSDRRPAPVYANIIGILKKTRIVWCRWQGKSTHSQNRGGCLFQIQLLIVEFWCEELLFSVRHLDFVVYVRVHLFYVSPNYTWLQGCRRYARACDTIGSSFGFTRRLSSTISPACDNKKSWNFSSLTSFFRHITSSSERNQITPLLCFLYIQSQSSSKPFSLLWSTLNCDLWLKYPHRSERYSPGNIVSQTDLIHFTE